MTKVLDTGTYSVEEIPTYVSIGKYCSVAAKVYFHEPNDQHLCAVNKECVFTTNWDQPNLNGGIEIGNDVWIGYGASILQEVKIGNGAIIGAHAVVAKDVPSYAVIVGNPQVIKRFRFTLEQIEKLEKIKWWDWPKATIEERRNDMKDIDIFLEKYG